MMNGRLVEQERMMDQSAHSEDIQRYRRALTESSDGELLQVLLVLLQLVNDEEKDDRASSD